MFSGVSDGAVDRTVAPCGNFRRQFTARGKGVNPFAHAFHREGWTPLYQGITIVDMMGMFGVLATAAALSAAPPTLDRQRLPQLPARGFALDTRAGVQLQTMRGRPLGLLAGLDLAADRATSHSLLMRDRQGRLYALDLDSRRVRRVFEQPQRFRGCRLTDARVRLALLVCGHTVKTVTYRAARTKPRLRVVAKAPGRVGHWVWAVFAPRGNAFLAQWSAECEVPVAFLVAHAALRPYGARTIRDAPASVAIGWLPHGEAVIWFPAGGGCGSSFRIPGIYAVPPTGKARLLLRTRRGSSYWMWGG